MQVTLSGGDQGGLVVTWTEGQQEMTFSGLVYRLLPDNVSAVYTGPAA